MGVEQTVLLIETTTDTELLMRANELLGGIDIFLNVIVWLLFMIPVSITAYFLIRMIMRMIRRYIKLPW